MAIINTHTPETAEGEVKEILETVQGMMNTIPGPMKLASASPWMIKNVWGSVQYFSQHPNLGFGLLSAIRYLVARQADFTFCTGFNKNFLQLQGMTDEDIEQMVADPSKAPLEDKDRALLVFVARAVKDPDAVGEADMDSLTSLSGIGKKTAQRLIVELKDKIAPAVERDGVVGSGVAGDAVRALMSLGYTRAEATRAVKTVVQPRPPSWLR